MQYYREQSITPREEKPLYMPPQIVSYTIETLQQHLGPARAISEGRISDEVLLFGEEFRD